jgi:hypothetical protein
MLTAKLILERFSKEGRLLERREKPAKSFIVQLMDFLYLKHAQINRDVRDTENTLRTLIYTPTYTDCNLGVGSPGGHTGHRRLKIDTFESFEGQEIGIQVGRGATSPTPTDYKMEDRILHGRCGKAGAKADFLNPSFETGDLTSWVEAHVGNMVGAVGNGVWALKDGTWYCTLLDTGAGGAGDYAQVSQDIDLSNVTHLRFQLKGVGTAQDYEFQIFVDGHPVYRRKLSPEADYPNQLADVCAFTGVCTVTFKLIAVDAFSGNDDGVFLDNIETLQYDPEIEYGGCELINLIFSDPDGEFTIRRYFTNNSGVSITVEEVGIQVMGEDTSNDGWVFLIARDLTGGIAVADTEILRVTYVPQITV